MIRTYVPGPSEKGPSFGELGEVGDIAEPHSTGSTVAPGAHDRITGKTPQVVKEGGIGLSEEMSAAAHEMCHALWTRKLGPGDDAVVAVGAAGLSVMVAKHASVEMPSTGNHGW